MTMLEMFNEVSDMEDANEIKMVVKKALLEELAGNDFIVKQQTKRVVTEKKEVSPEAALKKKISNEVFKRVKAFEKDNKRDIREDEKNRIRNEVTKEFNS